MSLISEVFPTCIAVISIFIAYLSYRDKKLDKSEKELSDRIKALALSDAVNIRIAEIKELQIQENEIKTSISILNERVNSLIIKVQKLNEIEIKINIIDERVNVLIKTTDKLI